MSLLLLKTLSADFSLKQETKWFHIYGQDSSEMFSVLIKTLEEIMGLCNSTVLEKLGFSGTVRFFVCQSVGCVKFFVSYM